MNLVNILLVEDNEGDIILTQEAFKSAAFFNTFNIVRDGDQAIDYLQNCKTDPSVPKPDLILLDINIPKINGLELLQMIRNDEALKNTHVIVVTSSAESRDIELAFSRLVDYYIVKPLDFKKFNDAVAQINGFSFVLVKTVQST